MANGISQDVLDRFNELNLNTSDIYDHLDSFLTKRFVLVTVDNVYSGANCLAVITKDKRAEALLKQANAEE